MTQPKPPTLPATLAARPKDRRGLPIPFVQHLDDDGQPDFTAIDGERVQKVGREARCGLCGEPLTGSATFLGGPKSGSSLVYGDPPMHRECAEYALAVCPHMAYQQAQRSRAATGEFALGTDDTKPAYWVMTLAAGYTMNPTPHGIYFLAARPIVQRTFRYGPDGRLWEDKA